MKRLTEYELMRSIFRRQPQEPWKYERREILRGYPMVQMYNYALADSVLEARRDAVR